MSLYANEEAKPDHAPSTAVATVPALIGGVGVFVGGVTRLAFDEGVAIPPALALVSLANVPGP